jgi:Tfp pilus assembly protein PilF
MKRHLRWLCAVAVLAVVTATQPLVAQEWTGNGRVKIIVKAEGGAPIAGAKVILQMAQDRSVGPQPFATNKKGVFSYLGLRGGTWVMRIEAEGYEPFEDIIEVYSSGSPENERVFLIPLPADVVAAQQRLATRERLDKGKELLNRGDAAGAIAEYEAALAELDTADHPAVLSTLAAIYLNEGNLEEAEKLLDQSLAIDPGHVDSLKAKSAILASQGKMEEAEALLAEIPEDAAVHPNTLMNIAMTHYNQGEIEEAKVFLDRAIRDNPEIAQAYYLRGLVGLNLGDQEGAKADFGHYLELDPDGQQAAEAKEYLGYLGGAEPEQ